MIFRLYNPKNITKALVIIALSVVTESKAQLKIYYIRHAEAGHNVVREWKNVPESDRPSFVGNSSLFTYKGEAQRFAAVKKLTRFNVDFIAVSPMYRTRNTVLPYLKKANKTAEVWPELREMPHNSQIIEPLPDPDYKILGEGKKIEIPSDEAPFIMVREGALHEFKSPFKKSEKNDTQIAIEAQFVMQKSLDMIKERFAGTNKSILLVGHGSGGKGLLKMLTKNELNGFPSITNTGIWMVEEQADGTYALKIYNDTPIGSLK